MVRMLAMPRHMVIALLVLVAMALPLVAQTSQPPPGGINRDFVLDLPAGPPRTGIELTRETEIVADRVRCPQCQGLSVADSPSNTARAMKAEVRDMLAEGYSEEQVLNYFEASYGEFIRLEPKIEGFNLVVWLAPFGIFALGIVIVALRLRSNAAALAALNAAERGGSSNPVVEDTVAEDTVAEDDSTEDPAEDVTDDGLEAYRERVRRETAS